MLNDPDYQEMQAEHLKQLVERGQTLTNNLASAVSLLKESMFGNITLTEADQREIFDIVAKTIDEQFELLDWSIQTRQEYINSRKGKDS